MNDKLIKVSTAIINKDLGLDDKNSLDLRLNTRELLKEHLEKILTYLVDNEQDKLIQAMYRIDINEQDFVSALQNMDIAKIADLIIERELQKALTREKYK